MGDRTIVKLDKIYTKGGDKGETSLGDGTRLPKHDIRVAAYGTTDEANAVIGLARLHATGTADEMLSRIQNDLFDVGADLCTPEAENPKYPPLRVTAEQVARLEGEIDAMNAAIAPMKSFVLPGGSALASWLHLARTVVRRAERLVTELAASERINPSVVQYLNRLSDHLFVLARQANDDGRKDVPWIPGGNR